jgi:hypothetical protein
MGMLEDDLTEHKRMAERDQRIADLEKELGRAYRCIRGFWTVTQKGELVADKTMLAYHSPTIGAACRFVAEGALDGAEYFIGKPVDILHKALSS